MVSKLQFFAKVSGWPITEAGHGNLLGHGHVQNGLPNLTRVPFQIPEEDS